MTPPLPDRIAAAITDLTQAIAGDHSPKDKRECRETLIALFAEVVAERDDLARKCDGNKGWTSTVLFDEARAERDAATKRADEARTELAEARAKLAELRGWCSQKRAEWTAEARGASSKPVSASCSMAASAFDEVAKKIEELGIAAAEQGGA